MKRVYRTVFIVASLFLIVALTLPLSAFGSGTIKAYTNQAEVVIGEEIIWYIEMTGFFESTDCAFFLFHDASLIAYDPPSGATIYRFTPKEVGTYKLVVLVRDSTGMRTASSDIVTVRELLHVESITVNRPLISLGAVATWTVCAQGGSGDKSFGFFVYRDGELLELCVPDDPKSGILNYTPAKPGTYTVDVLASDASGKAKMAGAPIIVTDGSQETKPLMLTSVYANTPDAFVGDEVIWTATASGGHEAIAFTFFLYKDGALVSFTPVGTSSVFRLTPTEPGIYAVSAHASSGLENANLISGSVTVARPAGVRLTGVSCDKNKAALSESITFTAQAEGASGEVAYSFALYRDWVLIGLYETGASPMFSFSPTDLGIYSVVAYAKDDVRSASASSAEVRVVSAKLTVDSVTVDQLNGTVGKPVTWTVHTSGGENLKYMYFIYFYNEIIHASPITTENTFTYTPTASVGSTPYVLKGLVSDGVQTTSFSSAGVAVVKEDRSRIIAITPDKTTASPGETITWTVNVDNGIPADSIPDKLTYVLYRDRGENDPVDRRELVDYTVYSFIPEEPGSYLLTVFIDNGEPGCHYEADAPIVRVALPMLINFDVAVDFHQLPGLSHIDTNPVPTMPLMEIIAPNIDLPAVPTTPAPTLSIPEIIVPNIDLPVVLATTRPPMAPAKPTPAPTLNLNLIDFGKPRIRIP